MSLVGLRVKNQDVCKDCKSKDCISTKNQRRLIGRSCQSELYPANITDNRSCILCTQCVKACSKDNIQLTSLERGYGGNKSSILSYSEVGMISILLGFVAYEILSSWTLSKQVLLYLPTELYRQFSLNWISPKLFEGFVLFILLPTIVLMLIALIARLLDKQSFGSHLKRSAFYLLPVIAFGHVFKALLKTTSRLPYWKYSVNDYRGLESAEKILNGDVVLIGCEWLDALVVVIGIAGLLLGGLLSIQQQKRDFKLNYATRSVYLIITACYLGLLIFGPLSQVFIK